MEAKITGIATIRRRQTHPIGQTGALGTIFSRSGTIGIRRTTPLPRLRQRQRIREDAITLIIIIFTPSRLDAVKHTGIRRITNFRTASFLTFQRSNTHGDRKHVVFVRTIYSVGTATHGYTTSIHSTTIFISIETRTFIRRTTRSSHTTINFTIPLFLTQFIIFTTFAHHITQRDPFTHDIIPTATGFTTIFDDNRNSITIHGTLSILTFQCPETHHCRE
mmetsp:Transcript_9731/g.10912  ORF Transcript_9731/g.10912 Transcript_9731/m.10912 type:complete len:220 (-) Transcript_9731:850-1509(-)